MKQFLIDGKNMLQKFLESIGQVVGKFRDFESGRSIGNGALLCRKRTNVCK